MEKSIRIELSPNNSSSKLYIFFGGKAAGIGMPPFEFYKYSEIMNENKIFIRDLLQCWYQCGLLGVSNDLKSSTRYIFRLVEEINPKDIFFVGNSMGGYAAILFASLIGKGKVITFAPQTFISPIFKFKYKDFRWKKQILITYIRSFYKNYVWNLRSLLLELKLNQEISIFVSKDNKLDLLHALYIKDIPNVHVYEFKNGGHEIVKTLRDNGLLAGIMSGEYLQNKVIK